MDSNKNYPPNQNNDQQPNQQQPGQQQPGQQQPDQPLNNQSYNGQQPNGQMNPGQGYSGQPYNGQPYGNQPYNNQPYGGQPYGNQPYNGQPYGTQPPHGPKAPDGKAFSVTALVLGICSAFFSMFLAAAFPINLLFLACGIVGIVLGLMGRKKSQACYGRPSGLATAGFILSIIGSALSALFILSCLACVACIGSEIGALDSMFDSMM